MMLKGKRCILNLLANQVNKKLLKEESVKDIDSKISVISTISGKQNTVKDIRHRIPQTFLCMLLIFVLFKTVLVVKWQTIRSML